MTPERVEIVTPGGQHISGIIYTITQAALDEQKSKGVKVEPDINGQWRMGGLLVRVVSV